MAYRIKGVYTQKQRNVLGLFAENYCKAISDPEVGPATRQLIEDVFRPTVLLVRCALATDNCAIIWKAMGMPVRVSGQSEGG